MVEACYVLGLEKSCSKKSAKKAYRDWTKKFHPDKVSGAEKKLIANKIFNIIASAEESIREDKAFTPNDNDIKLFGDYFENKDGINTLWEKFENNDPSLLLGAYKRDCYVDYNRIFEFEDGNNLDEQYQSLKSDPKFLNNPFIINKIENAYTILKNNLVCSQEYQDKFFRSYFMNKDIGFRGYLKDLKIYTASLSSDQLKAYDPSRFFLRQFSSVEEAFNNVNSETFSNKETIKSCLRYHLYQEVKNSSPEKLCGRYTLRPEGDEITENLESYDKLKSEPKFSYGIKITKVEALHAQFKLGPSVQELRNLRNDPSAVKIDCDINYYKILQLEEGANSLEVRNARDKLNSKFKDYEFLKTHVSKAYEVLITEESRQNYLAAKNDCIQNKESLVKELLNKDKFLQKYFVEQDNGLMGAFNDVLHPKYLFMSDADLKQYDIIRHTLKNNEEPRDALNVLNNLSQDGVDFSGVKQCLSDNLDVGLTSMDLCGKHSLHQEGFEPYQ